MKHVMNVEMWSGFSRKADQSKSWAVWMWLHCFQGQLSRGSYTVQLCLCSSLSKLKTLAWRDLTLLWQPGLSSLCYSGEQWRALVEASLCGFVWEWPGSGMANNELMSSTWLRWYSKTQEVLQETGLCVSFLRIVIRSGRHWTWTGFKWANSQETPGSWVLGHIGGCAGVKASSANWVNQVGLVLMTLGLFVSMQNHLCLYISL